MGLLEMTVRIDWTGASGSPGFNLWCLRSTTNDSIVGLCDRIRQFYNTGVAQIMAGAATVSFDGTLVPLDSDAQGQPLEGYDTWSIQGGGSGYFAPPSSQCVMDLQTAHYGRTGRGRKFFSPISTGSIDNNGQLTQAAHDRVMSTVPNLVAGGPGDGAIAVYSRKNRVAYDITGASVPLKLGVLRSRRD